MGVEADTAAPVAKTLSRYSGDEAIPVLVMARLSEARSRRRSIVEIRAED
jgi:hypothetical protein